MSDTSNTYRSECTPNMNVCVESPEKNQDPSKEKDTPKGQVKGGDNTLPLLKLTLSSEATADEDFSVKWNALRAIRYTLTVMQDSDLIITFTSTDPDAQIRLPNPGIYEVRVKAQLANGKVVSSDKYQIHVNAPDLFWTATITDQTISQNEALEVKAAANLAQATYSLDLNSMTCDNGTWNPPVAIDSETGTVTGTPLYSDVGSCTIKIQASAYGQFITSEFTVTVLDTNDAPVWVDHPEGGFAIADSHPLSLIFSATDYDAGDSITYALDHANSTCDDNSNVSNLSISPTSGALSANVAGLTDVETCTVRVTATDSMETVFTDVTVTLYPALPPAFTCDSGDVLTECIVSTGKSLSNGDVIAFPGSLKLVDGGTITANAQASIGIYLGGSLTISSGSAINANVSVSALNVIIEEDTGSGAGKIDATGLGYTGGAAGGGKSNGPGASNSRGAGGGHGGAGGIGSRGGNVGLPHGDLLQPTSWGTGGTGDNIAGASGGGAIAIRAINILNINGSLIVNGQDGQEIGNSGGGGAAGSIWIQAVNLTGNGSLSAHGGKGGGSTNGYAGGGGAGGRIALHIDELYDFKGDVSVLGGDYGGGSSQRGEAGTFHLSAGNVCDEGSVAGPSCTINSQRFLGGDFILTAASLHLSANAYLRTANPQHSIGIVITNDVQINTDAMIESNISEFSADNILLAGTISTNLLGERGQYDKTGLGPGAGVDVAGSAGGGGGHGGKGGTSGANQAGGGTYGDKLAPVLFGSSGGGGKDKRRGGHGGGAIKISARETLTITGTVSADGESIVGVIQGGGGAGGSIWLLTNDLAGNGVITANGGSTYAAESGFLSGGGGGGRIAVEYNASTFAGQIDVAGGTVNRSDAEPGENGTICLNGGGPNC